MTRNNGNSNDAPHVPQTKPFKLAIVSVNVKINANDKVSIKTVEGDEINPSGLFQMSERHLDNLADKCGAHDGVMLRNAIADQGDDSYLVGTAIYAKAGEKVLDDNGEEIEDPATQQPMVYTKDHWKLKLGDTRIELGDDAKDYIATINQKADLAMIMDSRKRNRKAKARNTTPTVNDAAEDEGLE